MFSCFDDFSSLYNVLTVTHTNYIIFLNLVTFFIHMEMKIVPTKVDKGTKILHISETYHQTPRPDPKAG